MSVNRVRLLVTVNGRCRSLAFVGCRTKRIVASDEVGQLPDRRCNRLYPDQTQFLHHSVLQRAERSLNPALRLRLPTSLARHRATNPSPITGMGYAALKLMPSRESQSV